jgi:RimJ/RimL family protein N-acetyltransferase
MPTANIIPPFLGKDLLRGELIQLARPTKADIAEIARWSEDMEYQRLLRRGMVYPGSVEEHEDWFADMAKSEDMVPFVIRTLDEDKLIGLLVIKDIMWQARHCAFFIGIGEAEMRGRGYGVDAIHVMLKYAFLEMNLNRVGLEVMSYNEVGLRTYKKVGFRHEGILRAYGYRDGIYYDMHLMGILRSEWDALYGATTRRVPEPLERE